VGNVEMGMIRKQYHRFSPGYFYNFINAHDGELSIEDELKKYNATIAKSKNENYKMNVKWHDPKLYTWFVLRWS
jgi:hypothetical protein